MKSELLSKVQDRLTSQKVTNFKEVVKIFEVVFDGLTSDLAELKGSNVRIGEYEGGNRITFNILEYDLGLSREGKSVLITKGDANKDETIGYVRFKGNYSFIQVLNGAGEVAEDFYLSEKKVMELFAIAFEPLLRETL